MHARKVDVTEQEKLPIYVLVTVGCRSASCLRHALIVRREDAEAYRGVVLDHCPNAPETANDGD